MTTPSQSVPPGTGSAGAGVRESSSDSSTPGASVWKFTEPFDLGTRAILPILVHGPFLRDIVGHRSNFELYSDTVPLPPSFELRPSSLPCARKPNTIKQRHLDDRSHANVAALAAQILVYKRTISDLRLEIEKMKGNICTLERRLKSERISPSESPTE